ncbi:hypothetical protein EBU71_07170 [bacterium]|nr:hypothetical protein [Candidatus Elulimicrobium humile]
MTYIIENQLMQQARNAGDAMGKIGFVKMKLELEIEAHKKWMKKPDAVLLESLADCIKTLDQAYQTLRK